MRFPILQNKKYGFIFSGILISLSLFFLLAPGFRLSLGIDFTGGTEIIWSFDEAAPSAEELESVYRNTLGDDISAKASELQNSEGLIVRSHILSDQQKDQLVSALLKIHPSANIQGLSTVGSSLGDHFQSQAFKTLAFAIIAIILFLAWAFRSVPAGISSWKFGLAAITALVHDVLIIAGVFAFLGQFMPLEVDTLFVTALLTVIGFSVHDTIVVFDRLRENLKGKKSRLFEEIAENSLWQTMGRSLHTSISTLFVLVAILVYGPDSISAFIFALSFGIFIGTYSSIFIATPLLVQWVKKDLETYEEEEEIEYAEGEFISKDESKI